MDIWFFLKSLTSFAVILMVMVIVFYIYSIFKIRKRRKQIMDQYDAIKPGLKVEFAGGFVGTIRSVGEDYCQIELNKDNVVTVSRLSITSIIAK